MKLRSTCLILAYLFFSLSIFAQKNVHNLHLNTGTVKTESNLNSFYIDSFNKNVGRFQNKTLAIIRFNSIPDNALKSSLALKGIILDNYLSDNSYTATLQLPIKLADLSGSKMISLVELTKNLKISESLKSNEFPHWIVKPGGMIDVAICFPLSFSIAEVRAFIEAQKIEIINDEWLEYGKLSLRIHQNRLNELAAIPFVESISPVMPELLPLNENSRELTRSNMLNQSVANGGLGLNGEGVVIGIGDNVTGKNQADFAGRLIQRNTVVDAAHGIHVMGTAAGAGNIEELYRGFASKATILDALQSDILSSKWADYYGMVVTNNSYGAFSGCAYSGAYDYASLFLDTIAFRYPNLLHVFGCGNSGATNCSPYPAGFSNLIGWFQSAKNVLTVGATTDSGMIAGFSSKGPAMDGRVKPEIVAMGQRVVSSWPDNIYGYNNGTSMSSPAVAGGVTLLYQRYRQLNGGSNPKNALIKAIVCNGATDRGNAGPDYSYGFGVMNLIRSVDMLDKKHYFNSTVNHTGTQTHSVNVPAGTAQLKVMLYWNDPAGSMLAKQSLVNDLDLEVTNPSNATTLPLILDTLPANVNIPATNGVDHINNMEQVVIDNPAPGNYSFKIKGTAIVENPSQEYFVVYDLIPVSLLLTYPVGGEGIKPGESIKIGWDAYGNNTNSFAIEYSLDNGASWNTIDANVNSARRLFTWQVPSVASSHAQVRISQNGTTLNSVSRPFTIIGIPDLTLSAVQCESYISLNWTAIPSAVDYEVMMLQGDEMKSVGITTATSFSIHSLSKDSIYWVSVRARIGGKHGRRATAISRKPNDGNCSGSISDNDLKLDSILSPFSGRLYTSTALKTNQNISVRIKNLDDVAVNGCSVQYSINGSLWQSESVNVSIAPGASYDHIFSATHDLSALGNYKVIAVVKNNSTDLNNSNDTLEITAKQLDNKVIDLSTKFLDDLETAQSYTYKADTIGLTGIDRYDFQSKRKTGELTTLLDPGMAYSGQRSMIMGESFRHPIPIGLNYITGTFNLSKYSSAVNDLRLDFKIMRTTIGSDTLWIRGADSLPWVKAYTLPRTTTTSYLFTPAIDISDTLYAYGQNFSSSFQVRWGQATVSQSINKNTMYSIDDISLHEVFNDVQVIRIDTPSLMSCSINGIVPVTITLHNHHNGNLNNVPVKYSIDSVNWVTENIPFIAGNSTLKYTFNQSLNLPSISAFKIIALVSYPTDSYRRNDTASTNIQSIFLVTNYPHIQNFETDKGGWFTEGTNSSWEYGTPSSQKINKAASGSKAWKTKLSGNYNDVEASYLYSACYRIAGMNKPTLSFSMAEDVEHCPGSFCDFARLEYTINGTSWLQLPFANGIINWYPSINEPYWRRENNTAWHAVSVALPANTNNIRFRFLFSSDSAINREGIAIDDFHIYDNESGIYDSVTLTNPITQNVSGNSWIDFKSDGKLVASIHPNNQSLGNTNVQAFIHKDTVRYTATQYYHNRNITIKPIQVLVNAPVTVRFYFSEKETDTLLNATGCVGCTKPSSAYELGISKYDDPQDIFENGIVLDNKNGIWSYLNSSSVIKVPFDKGYYAEFKVKDFSEFWLNNGGQDSSSHIALKLLEFTAQKSLANDVLLKWRIANDQDLLRYEIDLARGNDAWQANQFEKIGEIIATGNSSVTNYEFTDAETGKFGARYYRLKLINKDGSFSYSSVRSVVFDDPVLWRVYPNPSNGIFYLVYQVNQGEKIEAKLFDAKGSTVKQFSITGNGYPQKLIVDMSDGPFASGLYLLRLTGAVGTKTFKLYKQ